jgi:uncharacterized membrane-anchored protein
MWAQENVDSTIQSENFQEVSKEIESNYTFQQGQVKLLEEIVSIHVPAHFHFLDSKQTKDLLTNYWGEAEENANHLGLISSRNLSIFAPEAVVFTIDYVKAGHILENQEEVFTDEDFLSHFKQSIDSNNTKRKEAGLEPVNLNGWALKPKFDTQSHALYWIEDIALGQNSESRLSANLCILGRSGYIRFSSVCVKEVLEKLKNDLIILASSLRFEPEHQYGAFKPAHEKASPLSLEALILGYNYPNSSWSNLLSKYWKLASFLILIFGFIFLNMYPKKSI